ncbi:hypothetical protein [Paenibacillus sp.]|uniref:hypothetical protein n=1 Tax=Paenibacillus sp. TaxID=58172 RepID=UPI002D52B4F0|nr:hypothetical protein [Paenibacillus sp.]HZG85611.1 hypothetical protein [Paenibacillus sp.]
MRNGESIVDKILMTEQFLSTQKTMLMPDVRELQVYKEHRHRFESVLPYLELDIRSSLAIKNALSKIAFQPFTFAIQLVKTLSQALLAGKRGGTPPGLNGAGAAVGAVAAIDKHAMVYKIQEMLREEATHASFAQELNRIAFAKVSTVKELSERSNIEYSYLNKLLNNKLRPNATISRDLTIKLCLALELDLLEANELMSRAGYILCGNTERDRLLSLCVQEKTGVMTANEILEARQLPLL